MGIFIRLVPSMYNLNVRECDQAFLKCFPGTLGQWGYNVYMSAYM